MRVQGSLGGVGECGGSHSLYVPWRGWSRCQRIEEPMLQKERLNNGLSNQLISSTVIFQFLLETTPKRKPFTVALAVPGLDSIT